MRRPVLANREALFNFLQQEIAFAPQECLLALFVDSRCGLIRSEIISAGTVSSTSADPFPLFQRGKELGAAALFLVHNHPSRDPRPSRPDILVTHRLKRIGHDLEMPLLDHFIVTGRGEPGADRVSGRRAGNPGRDVPGSRSPG